MEKVRKKPAFVLLLAIGFYAFLLLVPQSMAALSGPVLLHNSSSEVNGDPYTTASFTPSSNSLVIATGTFGKGTPVILSDVSTTIGDASSVTLLVNESVTSSHTWITVVAYFTVGDNPSNGTVRFDFDTAPNRNVVQVIEFTNYDSANPIIQNGTDTGWAGSRAVVNLSNNPDSNNIVMAIVGHEGSTVNTTGSGNLVKFSRVESGSTSTSSVHEIHLDNTTSPSKDVEILNASGTNNVGTLAAFEIAAANSPPTHDTPILNATDHPANSTTANLTAHPQNGADADGDDVSWIYDWRLNGSSLALVNWPLHVNGSTAKDFSTYELNGTVYGNVTWNSTAGMDSKGAFQFEPNGIIQSSDSAALNADQFTFTFWMKASNLSGRDIAGTRSTTGGSCSSTGGWQLQTRASRNVSLWWCDGGSGTATGPGTYTLPLDSWFHFALRVDGSTVKFFVNGSEVYSTSLISVVYSNHNLTIGRVPGTFPNPTFSGVIQDIEYLNRSLSPAQILQLYKEGNATLAGSSFNSSTLLQDETSVGDSWSACVTPSDGTDEGSTKCSSNLNIFRGIKFTSPTTANGTHTGQAWIAANVTAYDLNLDTINITLYNAGGTIVTSNTSTTSPFYWNITNLEYGTYYLNATANETDGTIHTTQTRTITLANGPPTHDTPILNATDHPLNTSSANLTAYSQNGQDIDGDKITWVYDWRLDGTSIALLNMPFNTNVSTNDTNAVGDYSIYGNNGTLGDGNISKIPTWTSNGVGGGTYSFDSDFISLNTTEALANVFDQGGTISMWVNYSAIGIDLLGYLIEHKGSTTGDGYDLLIIKDGVYKVRFRHQFTSGQARWDGGNLNLNTWYHIAVTYNSSSDQNDPIIYINGVDSSATELNSPSGTAAINLSAPWTINSEGGFSTTGMIDEVLVYNRSLSAEQIYQLYLEGNSSLAGQPLNKSSLVSQETAVGESWSVAITPNDAEADGNTKISNAIIIQESLNSAPTHDTPIINASDHPINSSSANLTVYSQNGNDEDGDDITWMYDWRVDGESIAVLNMPFNTNVSTNATNAVGDYTTYQNNGTLGNGNQSHMPTWTPNGIYGGAYNFTNDTLEVGSVGVNGTQPVTLMMWIKPTDGIPGGLRGPGFNIFYVDVSQGTSGGPANDIIAFAGHGGGVQLVYLVEDYDNSTWYHITMSYNGTDFLTYLNGSFFTSVKRSLTTGGNATFGHSWYTGLLDQVHIFNRSLSQQQIQQIYNEEVSGLGNTSEIVSQEISGGQTWQAAVTPTDGQDDGITKLSNNITITNSAPTHDAPILNATDDPINSSSANLTAYPQNGEDADGDNINYIYDWRMSNISIAALNLPWWANESIRDFSTNNQTIILGGGNATRNPTRYLNGSNSAYSFNESEDDVILVKNDPAISNLLNATGGIISFRLRTGGLSNGERDYILDTLSGDEGWSIQVYNDGDTDHWLETYCAYSGTNERLLFGAGFDEPFDDNIWYNVTMIASPGGRCFDAVYFNGVQGARINMDTGDGSEQSTSSNNLTIGNSLSGGNSFNGEIADVLIIPGYEYEDMTLPEANELAAGPLRKDQNWSVAVTPSDGLDYGTTRYTNEIILTNGIPTHDTPILNSTDHPTNSSNANLTAYPQNGADADGDNITYIYDWRVDGESIAVLNMPFNTNVSNGAVTDYSTYGNNGTLHNGTSWTNTGARGGAYAFDGVDDHLMIPDTSSLDTTTALSVSAWVNQQALGVETIISKWNFTIPSSSWALQADPFDPTIISVVIAESINDGEGQAWGATPASWTTGWHHVAFTYDGSGVTDDDKLKIYIDGTQQVLDFASNYEGGPNIPSTIPASDAPIVLGRWPGLDRFWNGTIDEVRIYNRTLSAAQIYQLYSEGNSSLAGQPLNESSIVSQETSSGQTWQVAVTPTDGQDDGITKLSNNITITNSAPTHDIPVLNATDHPLNTTNANLTVYPQNYQDEVNDLISFSYDWREDGKSLALLNLPLSTNSSSTSIVDRSSYNYSLTYSGLSFDRQSFIDSTGATIFTNTSSLQTGNNASFETNTFTALMWVNVTNQSDLIGTGYPGPSPCGSNKGWRLQARADGSLSLAYCDDPGDFRTFIHSNLNVAWNNWQMIGIVKNSTHIVIYLNDTTYTDTTQDFLYNSGNTLLAIGDIPGGDKNLTGSVRDVLYLNQTLSDEQITQWYQEHLDAYNTSVLVSQETLTGENWTSCVTPSDGQDEGTTKCSNELIVLGVENSAPTHDTPVLNATDHPTNSTTANLTVHPQNYNDADEDDISFVYDWREDGTSMAVLNMPFNTNISTNATGAVKDYSTYQNNGTLGDGNQSLMPTWTSSGLYGGAYNFTSDSIHVGSVGVSGNMERTMMMWIKPAGGNIGGFADSGDDDGFAFAGTVSTCGNASIKDVLFTAGKGASTGLYGCVIQDYDNQTWYHIAVTHNTTHFYIYVNGSQVIQDTITLATNDDVWLGQGTAHYRGLMDQVLILNRSLSAYQIQQIYLDELNDRTTRSMVSQETDLGNNWTVAITPSDGTTDGTTKTSNNLFIRGIKFTSPTTANGTHIQDWIITNVTAYDLNLDAINITLWNSTGGLATSNTSSTSPFHWNITSLAYGTYYLNATANETDGTTYKTGTRTIILQSGADNPILNATDHPYNTSSANLTLHPHDSDVGQAHYVHDWRENGTSIAVLNMPFGTNASTNNTGAVRDYSTFGHNGTLGGGNSSSIPTWIADGITGGAYSFDGIDDFIRVKTDSTIYDLPAGFLSDNHNYSLSLWFNPKSYTGTYDPDGFPGSAGASVLLSTFDGDDGWVVYITDKGVFHFGDNNSIVVRYVTSGNDVNWFLDDGNLYNFNNWTHFAISDNAFYVNGVSMSAGTLTASGSERLSSSENLTIGAHPDGTLPFNGTLSEVVLYNRTLTEEQIQQIYQEGFDLLNNQSTNISTLVSQETRVGHNWTVSVTAVSSMSEGTTKISNNVEIISCTAGNCGSDSCINSFYQGSSTSNVCCAVTSCVDDTGSCVADGSTSDTNTCYNGTWLSDGGRFLIQNSTGSNLLAIDQYGSMVVSGSVTTSCALSPTANSWQVQNSTGTPIWVNTTGDMCVADSIFTRNAGSSCTAVNCYEIQSTGTTPKARFMENGSVYIAGDYSGSVGTIS